MLNIQKIERLFHALKSKGRLLLTTPNPDYLRLKLTGSTVLGGAHVSQYYPNFLKEQLQTIGFTNIKILYRLSKVAREIVARVKGQRERGKGLFRQSFNLLPFPFSQLY